MGSPRVKLILSEKFKKYSPMNRAAVRKWCAQSAVVLAAGLLPLPQPAQALRIAQPGQTDQQSGLESRLTGLSGLPGRSSVQNGSSDRAGLETTLAEAPPGAWTMGVDRVRRRMAQLGIAPGRDTTLTPGEILMLGQFFDDLGRGILVPMDHRQIEEWVPDGFVLGSREEAGAWYRMVIASTFQEQLGRPIGFVFPAHVLRSETYRQMRSGETPPQLRPVHQAFLEGGANDFSRLPILVQGEDLEIPRWLPAHPLRPAAEVLREDVVGEKFVVLLPVEVPAFHEPDPDKQSGVYHPYWSRLREENMGVVRERAVEFREAAEGEGFGFIAGAIFWAPPPRGYLPDPSDEEAFARLEEELRSAGRTTEALQDELAREEPELWAIAAQAAAWSLSRVKREVESSLAFSEAHERASHRMAQGWGRAPGVTAVLMAGPRFLRAESDWSGQRAAAISEFREVPGSVRGRVLLLNRDRPLDLYLSELQAGTLSGGVVGAASGRALLEGLTRALAGRREFPVQARQLFQSLRVAEARVIHEVAGRVFYNRGESIWAAGGIRELGLIRELIAAARGEPTIRSLIAGLDWEIPDGAASSANAFVVTEEALVGGSGRPGLGPHIGRLINWVPGMHLRLTASGRDRAEQLSQIYGIPLSYFVYPNAGSDTQEPPVVFLRRAAEWSADSDEVRLHLIHTEPVSLGSLIEVIVLPRDPAGWRRVVGRFFQLLGMELPAEEIGVEDYDAADRASRLAAGRMA